MTVRPIHTVFKSQPTLEGAGVLLHRAFGLSQVPELDPFLLLDEFNSDNVEDYLPGFPFHPHRGFQTLTYILHGEIEHEDSLGNTGILSEGEAQWMTAGSGIIHQEMPKGDASGLMQGYQIWLNMPASRKMIHPEYRHIERTDIPEVDQDTGAVTRVLAGVMQNTHGPVQETVTNPQIFDVIIHPKGAFSQRVPQEYTAIAYVMEGRAYFDEKKKPYLHEVQEADDYRYEREALTRGRHAVLYGDGDEVDIQAGAEGCRVLFLAGRPLNEPVAWGGSIVMNTEEELQAAFDEVRIGTFIKYGKPLPVR